MATMIPGTPPPPGPGKRAERAVYEALDHQLGSEFHVYHGLLFIEQQQASEGEVDFLVVHSDLGMLAIECKGSGVRRRADGRWLRMVDGAEQLMSKGPYEQAQGHIKDLVKELKPRVKAQLPAHGGRFPLLHGHAVAFPLALRGDSILPLEVPPKLLLDAEDMGRIGERVLEIFAFWKRAAGRPPAPMTPGDFRVLREAVLHPQLNLLPSLGASIALGQQTFIRLTQEQVEVLKQFVHNPRLKIAGAAGTGKTVLALEVARIHAEKGARVLLTCYTGGLSRYLKRQVAERPPAGGQIKVLTFHGLCRWGAGNLGEDFKSPKRSEREKYDPFWDNDAPNFLMDARNEGKLPSWDAIVVDEGQDFTRGWWDALKTCLTEPEAGHITAFLDPEQAIYGRQLFVPPYAEFLLSKCFRNTKQIAGLVQRFTQAPIVPHPRCPEGQAPTLHPQTSRKGAREAIEELVKTLTREEAVGVNRIAILTPHTRPNSCLEGASSLGGFALADNPLERDGQLLHTTISGFKGLESDVVILADMDPADERCSRRACYVAASRARQLLHVFTKGDIFAVAET